MAPVNNTDFRSNLKHWLDKVVNDVSDVVIKRKNGKDLVLISMDEYNSLKATIYLRTGKNRESFITTPFEAIGKPEALKGDLQGYWSRRITSEHRLVYKYANEEILIAACCYHYGK